MSALPVLCSLIMISFNFVISTDYIDNVTIPINASFFLYRGDIIHSRSMKTFLNFQDTDGNLVLYVREGESLWNPIFSTKTNNQNAKEIEITSSGNIFMRDISDNIIWNTFASAQVETQRLRLSVIDKCVHLTDNQYSILWSRGDCNCSDPSFIAPTPYTGDPTASPTLSPIPMYQNYVTIPTDESFILESLQRIWSTSMDTALVMQIDGNLVLYNEDTCIEESIWHTNTYDLIDDWPYMEVHSNAIITLKDKHNAVYWHLDTAGNIAMHPFRLGVATDCVFLIDSNLTLFWKQGPGCDNVVVTEPTSAPSFTPSISPTWIPTLSPSQSPLTVSPTNTPFHVQSTLHPTQFPTKYPKKASPADTTQGQSTAAPTYAPNDVLTTVIYVATTIVDDIVKKTRQTDYLLMFLLFLVMFLCAMVILWSLLTFYYQKKAAKARKDTDQINNTIQTVQNTDTMVQNVDNNMQMVQNVDNKTRNEVILEHCDEGELAITEEGASEQATLTSNNTRGNDDNAKIAQDEFVVIGDDEHDDTRPTAGE